MAMIVDEKRLAEMQDMRKRHFTYHDIAEHFGISRQRVYQILKKSRKRNTNANIEEIVYEGIYQLFINDPTMSYTKFSRILTGGERYPVPKIIGFLKGADTFLQISEIKNICAYIGKPFEEVFKPRKPKGESK